MTVMKTRDGTTYDTARNGTWAGPWEIRDGYWVRPRWSCRAPWVFFHFGPRCPPPPRRVNVFLCDFADIDETMGYV